MRKWMVVFSTQKEKIVNHNFTFEEFNAKFLSRKLTLFFEKPWFMESSVFSDSETLFKCKNWLE